MKEQCCQPARRPSDRQQVQLQQTHDKLHRAGMLWFIIYRSLKLELHFLDLDALNP